MSLVKFKTNTFPSIIDEFLNNEFFNNSPGLKHKNHRGHFSKPRVNIKETETAFELDVIAPGFNKDNFKVALEKDLLTISAEVKNINETSSNQENKESDNEPKVNYTHREFYQSSFKRSFNLPEHVNTENISANYTNGILTINIPKVEKEVENTTKLITIEG